MEVLVHEFYGDRSMALEFPETWDVKQLRMKGHDALAMTEEEMKDALAHPIGTPTIGELAKGKKGRVVIAVDDLTRPTPAHAVIPHVIRELNEAGVSDNQIFILCALGSHGDMNTDMFARKVGQDIIQKYDCINHTVQDFSHSMNVHNFVDLGFTSRNTPVRISRYFMKADLRIAITEVKKHPFGAGGGGKIVLPGVASLDTIRYNHTVVSWNWPASPDFGAFKVKGNPGRSDIQEAARMANLEFTLNCNINGKRELIGLHSGDLDEAWREAVKFCYGMHSAPAANKKVDIVVVNSYPQACDGINWEGAQNSLREGGSVVAIHQHPLGRWLTHYGAESFYGELWKRLQGYPDRSWPVKQAGKIVVYSERPSKRHMLQYSDRVEWVTDWSEVIRRLQAVHGEDATVDVYPCGPLQFDPSRTPLKM